MTAAVTSNSTVFELDEQKKLAVSLKEVHNHVLLFHNLQEIDTNPSNQTLTQA